MVTYADARFTILLPHGDVYRCGLRAVLLRVLDEVLDDLFDASRVVRADDGATHIELDRLKPVLSRNDAGHERAEIGRLTIGHESTLLHARCVEKIGDERGQTLRLAHDALQPVQI